MKIMKIMMVNDDGIEARGIRALANALLKAKHDVCVYAPDRDRSSIGHAMTLKGDLRLALTSDVYPTGVRAWSCSGTPTDSVILGLQFEGNDADIVISGINNGANLGDDITYSGTACAAMEAYLSGYPAIAVSLVHDHVAAEYHYATACHVILKILPWYSSLDDKFLLNVNVPNIEIKDLKGVMFTRQGKREYHDKITVVRKGEEDVYRLGGYPHNHLEEGTDVWAVSNGFAAVTPVKLDLTHFEALDVLIKKYDRVI